MEDGDGAPNAIDGDLGTQSATKRENRPWLEITFQAFQEYSLVEKVMSPGDDWYRFPFVVVKVSLPKFCFFNPAWQL